MKIWKNTSTLDGYDDGLFFTKNKNQADIALLGSKLIDLFEFPNLKGIFRAGVGKDNVPEKEAVKRNILVRYPSQETINIIFDETSSYTCSLIFRMLYSNVGILDSWKKYNRSELSKRTLLVIGMGNIGRRVMEYMRPHMNVITFDIIENLSSPPYILNPLAIIQSIFISLQNPSTNFSEDTFKDDCKFNGIKTSFSWQ